MSSIGGRVAGRTAWLIERALRQIWFRASIFSIAAILIALLAAFIGPYIPYEPGLTLASGAVDNILTILASSMLAVTTFSLSVMVSAYSAATSSATPRSTKLLLADPTAQNTLSTFVGSFLFSVVGIVGIVAGLYDGKARILLFFATLVVLAVVVAALLRWIEHLGSFGRVGDTIRRVEEATCEPLVEEGRRPRLGALPPATPKRGAVAICSPRTGHIRHIDVQLVERIALEHDLTIHLMVLNGALMYPARPLAMVVPAPGKDSERKLADCFTIGDSREFDNDPRFGLTVLSEIASRALSPAVNDPGTAIEVADSALRLLIKFGEARSKLELPCLTRVHAPELEAREMLALFFNPLARDGASVIEFQTRLVEALTALATQFPKLFRASAREQVAAAIDRSKMAMAFAGDIKTLTAAASALLKKP